MEATISTKRRVAFPASCARRVKLERERECVCVGGGARAAKASAVAWLRTDGMGQRCYHLQEHHRRHIVNQVTQPSAHMPLGCHHTYMRDLPTTDSIRAHPLQSSRPRKLASMTSRLARSCAEEECAAWVIKGTAPAEGYPQPLHNRYRGRLQRCHEKEGGNGREPRDVVEDVVAVRQLPVQSQA